MAKNKQEIIDDINAHINKGGGGYGAWYVGIANDAKKRLGEHNVTEWWIIRQASSAQVAREIVLNESEADLIYGYTIVSDVIGNRKRNTHLVENPEEQKILDEMKKLREEGRSYNEIATYFNEKRFKTRLKREGSECSWHPSTIRNILMRPEVVLNDKKEKT